MYTFQQENADFARILQGCKPYAAAYVKGSAAYPLIGGRILFYPAGDRGVLVVSNVRGLPVDDTACGARFFGMHIHEKGDCRPSDGEAFPVWACIITRQTVHIPRMPATCRPCLPTPAARRGAPCFATVFPFRRSSGRA